MKSSPTEDTFYKGIQHNISKKLLGKLKALEEKNFRKASTHKPPNTISRRLWVGSAVAASISLILIFNWDRMRPISDKEKIFWNVFEPYPYSKQIRGDQKNDFSELDQAIAHYVQGDYKKANKIFKKLKFEDSELRLVYTYSLIADLKIEQARNILIDLQNTSVDRVWLDKAHKYIEQLE